ncbi:MAG: crossover junction endodeoxyribonuclease RuvC [Planctomycetota bacterium]
MHCPGMGAIRNLPELPSNHAYRIVLGIDPGTHAMGYGAIVIHDAGPRLLAAGTLIAPRSQPIAKRLGSLKIELEEVLRRLQPIQVVVEKAFLAKNVLSALRIGEGRGVAMACASAMGAEVAELTAVEAKRALVGTGAASKHQVRRMVGETLGLEQEIESLDTSDALALALAWHLRNRNGAVRAPIRAAKHASAGGETASLRSSEE